ncbi:helix-turn-helix domain-containing protein [Streptomyces sp. DSM 110735]|uniref:helix-turn-helix domain-containing protein n=1 Tax=Streptomyces sp. DSM 110735 TaxID=2775031 RepID=UPI0018F7A8D1|nr:helix-turn-helix transcriptional regulator [Streptomyces sp. DSM 110735]MBJ7903418.1 helix-turn-helix transcriptional regulator [Streptomyces sp. DSM 110735]
MNAVRLWGSEEARSCVRKQDPGGLIRIGRVGRGWRLEDLGARIGCSAATVSRLERRGRKADFDMLMSAARAVEIPMLVLAASLGLTGAPATRVAPDGPRCAEEDPMRRRRLLAATGLAVPSSLLAGVSDALASIPGPTGSPVPLDSRLAAARGLFDAGQNAELLRVLPGLLADASHAASPAHEEMALARLSTAYSLAGRVLTKVGRYGDSRLAADRAALYAQWSGSPLAAAAAARELSIVLRHQDQPAAAERHILDAVAKVEETGLRTDAQRSAYAQMLCTTSYTAARAGVRDQALTMIRDAARAARALPDVTPRGRLFPLTPAAVDLYAVGVHWALGDAGAALEAGRGLHEGRFATAERKGRMHTDLGRAWWQWGKAEQAAAELLSAVRVSPGEVRDRPAIRQIVSDLRSRHPRVTGVRELVAAAGSAE